MKKTKLLTTAAVISTVCLTPSKAALADVDGYVIKDTKTNKLYQYSKEQLMESYKNHQRYGKDDLLYKDFVDKLSQEDLYMLHDDSSKYVSFKEAINAYKTKKRNNNIFDIDVFTEKAEAVKNPEYVYDRIAKKKQLLMSLI